MLDLREGVGVKAGRLRQPLPIPIGVVGPEKIFD
jgi:hypothetical protein